MNAESDLQLLRAYAVRRDEAAFRELVQRHTDFIYSAAVRQVESDAAARDVTQGVFTDLARRATDILGKHTGESLAGWLHRAARYAALNHLRDSRRRRDNERQAMEQLLTNSDSAADWQQIRPALDEALDALDDTDREAILLRYFKNQDFRTVGAQLGVSDDAAQKRVSRAVERLREFFAKRGVSVGAGGLVVVISANAVQAAPVGLAVTISAAALAGTAVTTSTLIAATTKTIAMTTLQKTLVTATVVVLAGAGIYQARQAAQLRDQVQTLQQQQANEVQQLQLERDEALKTASLRTDIPEQYRRDLTELLKLRRQVAAFQKADQERAQLEKDMNAKLATAKKDLDTAVANANFKMNTIKSANNLRQLGLAFKIFRSSHPHEPLTNLNQLDLSYAPLLEFAQNEVEYVNTQILDIGQYPRAILLREKAAHQSAAGKWIRNYCLADGAVLKAELDNNDFTDWERENTQIVGQQ